MVKEIRKIGNSKGVILDAAILDAMKVDVGDQVEVTIHASGSVTMSPVDEIEREEFDRVLKDTLSDYKNTLSKLS